MNLLLPYSRRRPRPPLLLATDASDNDNAPKTMITSCGHPQNLVATATILTYCLKQREKPPRNQRHSSTLDKGMVLLYVIAAISLTKSMHSVPFAVGFGFAPVPKQHNIVIQRVEIRNTFISPLKSISTISSKKSRLWLEANSANDDNKNNSNSNSNSNSNKGGGDDPSKPRKGRRTSGRPTRHFLRSQRKFEKEKNDYFDNDKQDSGRSSSRNFTSSSPASSIPTTSSSRSTKKPPTPSIRDQMSSPNHPRAKMKKLSSSSFSTLLPPPSILSRLSSTGSSSGRRWENTYGSQRSGSRGSASRSFQGNDDGGGTNGDGIRGGDQSRKWAVSASQLPSKKQKQPVRTFKASSKGESRREQQRGELSAKPKSGSSKERSSFTGGGSSWDSVFDYLPPPSSKSSGKEKNTDLPQWGSLFENQPGAPYPSSSESPLFSPTAFPSPAIDGVLPVSELFYRSTQSISSSMGDNEEEDNEEYGDNSNSKSSTSKASAKQHKKKKAMDSQDLDADELGDDEELPFSAEQSDRLSIPGNKIQIRRNKAAMSGGNDTSFFLDDIATGMGMSMGGSTFPSEAVQRELTTMAEQEQEEQRRLELRTRQQQQQQQQQQQSSSRAVNVDDNNEEEENDSTCEEDTVTKRKNDSRKGTKSRNRKTKSGQKGDRAPARKMVRRGMEMLVGGEPINADPPQRSIELNYYRKHPKLWARSITTNSPDFGPLLHMHSAGKVGEKSLGLYCENFVSVMQKWNICPDDLKFVVSEHEVRRRNLEAAAEHAAAVDAKEQRVAPSVSTEDMEALIQSLSTESDGDDESSAEDGTTNNSDGSPPALEVDIDEGIISDGSGRTIMFNPRELNAPKGFGAQKQMKKKSRDSRGGGSGMESEKSLVPVHTLNDGDSSQGGPLRREEVESEGKLMFTLGGELKFSLGVTRAELESGHGGAFRRVLKEGIGSSINSEEMGFDVHIAKLLIVDVEGGSTDVVVQFQLDPREAMDIGEAERAAKEVNGALASAMDDGKMALALAHVAREEKGWSAKIRNRIVEEFLFETEDDDEDKEFHSNENDADEDEDIEDFSEDDDDKASSSYERESDEDDDYDGPFGMEGEYAKDDIFLGGGNGGVFFDYSESNYLNSPYKGELGPYLVDAATERARQNHPRVIAIGDVHGCIDELQALLKKCDYHPGDTVVFLGDLVCKGPDSLSVVQMAREIGAIGVRGNHDFEVVRWHQAIKSGADPPVIGSEHYYVASALSTADLKWMYSLPWFISSSHLNALFVHAGFVSGIRLAKQNPRLMMNMRSILPDGTVTSKFFNNWPWARLWDGPQTVMFGHDADRGLQKYDHAIGLDTGCVYGGKLTACILPERRLVSVNAKREYFQYRRKHFD